MKTNLELIWRRIDWRVKWVAILVPALIVLGYLTVGGLTACTLSTPERHFLPDNTPAKFNLAYQDVRFPARGDAVEIAGWYIPHEGATRAVVLVPGRNSNRSVEFGGVFIDFAAGVHGGGFAILMIDPRGHGQSGDAHYSFGLNERRDVIGAVDWLKGKGFQPGSVGVYGVSMGAATAIGATAEDEEIGALVEESGFAEICPLLKQQWNRESGLPDIFLPSALVMTRLMFGYDICASRPVDEIGRIAPRSILIIHSTADVLVPVIHAERLKAAAPSAETWMVPGAEHARIFNADPGAYTQKVIEFFERSLKQ